MKRFKRHSKTNVAIQRKSHGLSRSIIVRRLRHEHLFLTNELWKFLALVMSTNWDGSFTNQGFFFCKTECFMIVSFQGFLKCYQSCWGEKKIILKVSQKIWRFFENNYLLVILLIKAIILVNLLVNLLIKSIILVNLLIKTIFLVNLSI